MADSSSEKTEQPTPKRLQDARRRGQIARSKDLSGALVTLSVFGVLAATAPSWFGAMVEMVGEGIKTAVGATEVQPVHGLVTSSLAAVWVLLFPLATALVVAVLVGGIMAGGIVSIDPMVPKLERLRPQLSRVFSLKSLAELSKGLLLVLTLGFVLFKLLQSRIPSLVGATGAKPETVVTVLGNMLRTLGIYAIGVTVLLGAADYLWQRRRLMRQLRMSRDEVKREYKETEGDPHHKAERQRVYHEVMHERAMAEVRKADMVVVNPEHIAVAIRYARGRTGAPVVVASGEDMLAARIKALAREAGIPIFRDVTLARSLREVNEGEEIPEILFEAVAELLRIVYGMAATGSAAAGVDGTEPPPAGWTRA